MVMKKDSFSDNFRQSFIGLIMQPLGLIAGLFIVTLSPAFAQVPWILILFQPFLSNNGNLGGIYCGNLSTSLHLGSIEPKIRNNTQAFKELVSSIVTLLLFNGIFIAVFGFILASLFGFISGITILSFFFISILTISMSGAFMLTITFFISIFGMRRGLDPDIILYPITATLNDIFVSFIFVMNINLFLFLNPSPITEVLGLVFLIIVIVIIILLFVFNRNKSKFKLIIKESFIVIMLLAFIDNITGTLLSTLKNKFMVIPALLIIYPALNSTVGAQASMITSDLSSDFPLGILPPKISMYKKEHFRNFLLSMILNGVIFSIFCASLGYFIGSFGFWNLYIFNVMVLVVLVDICAISIIQFMAVGFAIVFYMRGMDPDNFGNPILTSMSDLLATIFLSLFILLLI